MRGAEYKGTCSPIPIPPCHYGREHSPVARVWRGTAAGDVALRHSRTQCADTQVRLSGQPTGGRQGRTIDTFGWRYGGLAVG